MVEVLAVVAFSFITTLILVPAANVLGRRLDAVDRPDLRRIHKKDISRTGGFVLFMVSILVVTFLWCNNYGSQEKESCQYILYLFPALVLIGILGVIDDVRGADVWTKLFYQMAAAVFVMTSGLAIKRIGIPFDGSVGTGYFAYPLTLLWIVGITNAYNLIDGMDGLACGVGGTVALATSVIGFVNGSFLAASLSLSLAVYLFTFLLFNRFPAKIFLGDTGSLLTGFLIATTSLACFTSGDGSTNFFPMIVVNALVIWDTSFVFMIRLIKGRSPFSPGLDHIHHRMLGFTKSVRSSVRSILVLNLLIVLVGVSLLDRVLLEPVTGFLTILILLSLAISNRARCVLSALVGYSGYGAEKNPDETSDRAETR